MKTKNNLEQKIREMNLKVGDPVEATYGKGKSYVFYFGGLNDYCILGAKHLNSEREQVFERGYGFEDLKEIRKLIEKESLGLSLERYKKISLGEIIELDVGFSQYGSSSEGKNIGYFEGLQGEDYILHSIYKEGTPWYENSAGDSSDILAIKSIRTLKN